MIAWLPLAFATTREDALDSAAQFATHVWSMTSANTHASCSSDYESDFTAGTYTGLPYDWGGYMDLDEFDREIAAGYGAGSHSWHGILECTAGLDCSGFLSQVWGSSHISTSSIDNVAHEIAWSSIERADAVNDAGSHVVMFTHYAEDGEPVFWESCGSYGVRINNSGGWSYIDGYVPYRSDDIEDGTSTGTTSHPNEIQSFPYEDQGWTPGSPSDAVDVYNCSSADESGPEVWYHFTAKKPGTVTAVVSDEDDVDIDVYINTAPDGDHCLGRDDTEVSAHVDAGEVWISLDSYVGSREYSGPYGLTVDFQADDGSGNDGGDGGDTGADGGDTGTAGNGGQNGGNGAAPPSVELHPAPGKRVAMPTGCATTPVTAGWGVLAAAMLLRRRRA